MKKILAGLLIMGLAAPAQAIEKISLFALFKNKAILHIDGARRVVTVGEASPEGLKLVSTDTDKEEAVVEIGGKRQTLLLGVVGVPQAGGTNDPVVLFENNHGFFHAEGTINGSPVTFLVDTGANTVAMNHNLAQRVGIDYRKGRQGTAATASGYAHVYGVKLDAVKIGGIMVRNVDAVVFEGPQPSTPLLGMSFLTHVEMKRAGNRMELIKRY
jgi:aspartyl protease family protein